MNNTLPLIPGRTCEHTLIVSREHLAVTMKSGDLPVLATPALVALMEWAARDAVAPCLSPEQTTVGVSINIKHLRPSPLGGVIIAQATLEAVDGKRLMFNIIATQAGITVGEATHERFIVDRDKFLDKLRNTK